MAAEPLTVMSLNLQYYSSYPGEKKGRERLQEIASDTSEGGAPDIICVQEGLEGRNEITPALGYRRLVSSSGLAQSVAEMVYDDPAALNAVQEEARSKLLVNELYIKEKGSEWEALAYGVHRVSSSVDLDGTGGRVSGPLAIRTVVWAKLRRKTGSSSRPSVFVLCIHISGGRFEDQFFVQQLALERRTQVERAIALFKKLSSSPQDLGIIVGDFNATEEYVPRGPMQNYYLSAIKSSEAVQADAGAAKLSPEQLEDSFKEYLIAPFTALSASRWHMAYSEAEVGATSAFGHLIDHMGLSRKVPVVANNRMVCTNQKFGPSKDTEVVPITDHNAVKTTFDLKANEEKKWYSGLQCSCFNGCLAGILPSKGSGQAAWDNGKTGNV